ncbi:MAG: hypothetical protein A3F68_01985 [Acidobacteria bacterium RIFCSPLOWO2_12_FULL_54_10]|nr:MAG: hypothetical protein A3F68_01985 [Acidobacteria bacterium RIFCSPLOWO2_12_FULL_54_10]
MPTATSQRIKLIAILVLVPLSIWFAYRNIIAPGESTVAASQAPSEGALQSTAPARNARNRQDRSLNPSEMAAMDPTLQLELLQQSREVEYEGSSRNIFEYGAVPAAPQTTQPAPNAAQQSATDAAAAVPSAPKASIPLKFFGTSTRSGTLIKKAFLLNGDEVIIAEEGEIVDKRYKVIRIGINSVEIEDTTNGLREEIPYQEQ